MSQLAHPAAVGGPHAAAAELDASTDPCADASFGGAASSSAVSDSDEAALPPQTPLSGVSQLSSSSSGSIGYASGCSAGSGSGPGGHTATSGNNCAGSATRQLVLRTYEYHVLHSAAYGVPLLFLRGCHPGGLGFR